MGKPIVIVGAGLAGLVCARHLQRSGTEIIILEASDAVGGRIRTDVIDGFRVDRGFQVYFEGYPHASQEFSLRPLDMRAYRKGALVFDGKSLQVLDLSRPVTSLLSGALGFSDKLLLAKLAVSTLLSSDHGKDLSTEQFFRLYGFSDQAIKRFLRPFFGGIFLDPSLRTSSLQFQFLFQALLGGQVSTPALGIGALTQQVADEFPDQAIKLGTALTKLEPGRVILQSGEQIEAEKIVLACEPPVTAEFLKEPFFQGSVSATTVYFEASTPPVDEPIIVLNGSGRGPINLVAPLSVVSPQVAPEGKHLIAVTTFEPVDPHNGVEQIKFECERWFPTRNVPGWHHLTTVNVPFAQYRQDPGFRNERPSIATQIPGVFRTGEILTSSSIDGACRAGRMTAEAVIKL